MDVLVVDDDHLSREMTAAALKKLGCSAHAVAGMGAAQAWLSKRRPDLVIVDLLLPDGNGLDLCRWVRGRQGLETLPILATSGLGEEETIQDALESGASDFIRKPYLPDDLGRKLLRLLPK